MAKTGRQYAQDVRDLRAVGVDFPAASRGYLLADAANWSSGQKAAVTRAIGALEERISELFEETSEAEGGITDFEAAEFFADSFGEPDDLDEYDDVPFFDPSEAEEFIDEESDAYSEDEA